LATKVQRSLARARSGECNHQKLFCCVSASTGQVAAAWVRCARSSIWMGDGRVSECTTLKHTHITRCDGRAPRVLRAGSLGMSANCVKIKIKISDVSAACTFTSSWCLTASRRENEPEIPTAIVHRLLRLEAHDWQSNLKGRKRTFETKYNVARSAVSVRQQKQNAKLSNKSVLLWAGG